MDDLCIKMIANTRRLKTDANSEKHLKDPMQDIVQILKAKYLSQDVLQKHMSKFCMFLDERHPDIIQLFERYLHEKVE